jgi:hypothetical protein
MTGTSSLALDLAAKSLCGFSRALAVRHALPNESPLVPFGYILLLRLLCALFLILLAQGGLAELRWRGCGRYRLSHCGAPDNKGQCDKPHKKKHRTSHCHLHC